MSESEDVSVTTLEVLTDKFKEQVKEEYLNTRKYYFTALQRFVDIYHKQNENYYEANDGLKKIFDDKDKIKENIYDAIVDILSNLGSDDKIYSKRFLFEPFDILKVLYATEKETYDENKTEIANKIFLFLFKIDKISELKTILKINDDTGENYNSESLKNNLISFFATEHEDKKETFNSFFTKYVDFDEIWFDPDSILTSNGSLDALSSSISNDSEQKVPEEEKSVVTHMAADAILSTKKFSPTAAAKLKNLLKDLLAKVIKQTSRREDSKEITKKAKKLYKEFFEETSLRALENTIDTLTVGKSRITSNEPLTAANNTKHENDFVPSTTENVKHGNDVVASLTDDSQYSIDEIFKDLGTSEKNKVKNHLKDGDKRFKNDLFLNDVKKLIVDRKLHIFEFDMGLIFTTINTFSISNVSADHHDYFSTARYTNSGNKLFIDNELSTVFYTNVTTNPLANNKYSNISALIIFDTKGIFNAYKIPGWASNLGDIDSNNDLAGSYFSQGPYQQFQTHLGNLLSLSKTSTTEGGKKNTRKHKNVKTKRTKKVRF